MYERFTDRARKVMQLANQEAQRFNHEYIGTEHILLGIVKEGSGVAANVLGNLQIDLRKVRLEIEKLVQSGTELITMGKLPQTPRCKKSIDFSMEEARDLNHSHVGTEHLLLGLMRVQEGIVADVFVKLGLKLDDVRAEVERLGYETGERPGKSKSPYTKTTRRSKTPVTDSFCRDITALAYEKKLNHVVDREAEIQRLAMVLCQREQNSPVLIGEPGVGRTAIVHALANRMVREEPMSGRLEGRRIVELDQGMLVAGSKGPGEWLQRVQAITQEMKRAKNVLLFLPNLCDLVTMKDEGGVTLVGMLKRAMFHGEIQCISIATSDEYNESVSVDKSLERLFQRVVVEPPTANEACEILGGLRKGLEEFHRVQITESAINSAVELSVLYLPDRELPGNAINLLDAAGSRLQMKSWSTRPDTDELDRKIEEIQLALEKSLGNQEFEKAAQLRESRMKLENEQQKIIESWRESSKGEQVVDDAAVIDVLSILTGIPSSDIRDRKSIPSGR